MGYQPGHKPHNDWSKVNAMLATDKEARKRWIQAKKGQVAWNKGITKSEYPNGIKSGEAHGNWLGGKNGVRDTSEYASFRRSMWARDNYTCQICGDRNHDGRGSRIVLQLDHIEPVCVAPDRIMDPENVRTLCLACHLKTETFGTRVKRYIKEKHKKQAAPF